MTKTILFAAAAAALLAAPIASATAAPARHHRAAHHARPMHHASKSARMAPRDSGSAAVDALNDQALARARGAAQ